MSKIILRPGKEKPIKNRHHWIFSGAIEREAGNQNGDIVAVYSSSQELLGHAYYNSASAIRARMINFNDTDPLLSLRENIRSAIQLRESLFDETTNTYRVINGEGDSMPGLIVDRYAEVLVIQVSTLGMDKLKPLVMEELVKHFKPVAIYEKSSIHSREEEGLKPFVGVIYGELPEFVTVLEYGIKFQLDVAKAQKTGLFLDQREMRKLIGEYSKGRKVLNCFAYTGGFSLYAMRSGAVKVDSMDISADVMKQAEINFEINGFDTKNNQFIAADVFKFLRESDLNYDLVILDPPAFAKKRADIDKASGAYRDINRLAMQKMPANSFLLTCSCSYFIDEEIFQRIVFQAATMSGRKVRIVQKHHLAADHPINIYHPEGDYLKSLLLYVE